MRKIWTVEMIKKGLERFRDEYGRFPISSEIDLFGYLPSSRHIQKKFGGLVKLRSRLGYEDNHFGRGKFRSKIATKVNSRGRAAELSLEKILRDKFGEVFVHTERIFDDTKNRVDFYIYTSDGNFGVDIFYTETMRSLQSNINIKISKYLNFPHALYFVIANKTFKQRDLDKYVNSKTRPLPSNTRIVTLETLSEIIKYKNAYSNPLVDVS